MARKRSTLHPATERAVLTWAAQKRLVLDGGGEGYATRSTIEKIRRERDGAGEGGKKGEQHWPEVYWGDGLLVQEVLLELPELPRIVFNCYYLLARDWYMPVDEQARQIGIAKTEYWSYLGNAETGMETGLKLLRRAGVAPIVVCADRPETA